MQRFRRRTNWAISNAGCSTECLSSTIISRMSADTLFIARYHSSANKHVVHSPVQWTVYLTKSGIGKRGKVSCNCFCIDMASLPTEGSPWPQGLWVRMGLYGREAPGSQAVNFLQPLHQHTGFCRACSHRVAPTCRFGCLACSMQDKKCWDLLM